MSGAEENFPLFTFRVPKMKATQRPREKGLLFRGCDKGVVKLVRFRKSTTSTSPCGILYSFSFLFVSAFKQKTAFSFQDHKKPTNRNKEYKTFLALNLKNWEVNDPAG